MKRWLHVKALAPALAIFFMVIGIGSLLYLFPLQQQYHDLQELILQQSKGQLLMEQVPKAINAVVGATAKIDQYRGQRFPQPNEIDSQLRHFKLLPLVVQPLFSEENYEGVNVIAQGGYKQLLAFFQQIIVSRQGFCLDDFSLTAKQLNFVLTRCWW